MFDIIVVKVSSKKAKWEWRVCNLAGNTIASGREKTRRAAGYRACRALFQVLIVSVAPVNLGDAGEIAGGRARRAHDARAAFGAVKFCTTTGQPVTPMNRRDVGPPCQRGIRP